jgi:WD40 repeat protein
MTQSSYLVCLPSEPQERCCRSIAVSPDGQHLAVGTNAGTLNIYDARSLALVCARDLNSYGKVNHKIPENWIQDLKYSPDGRALAVATHGSVIVLLDGLLTHSLSLSLSLLLFRFS